MIIENKFKDYSTLTVLSLQNDWQHALSCVGSLVESPEISHTRRYQQSVLGALAAYSSIQILNTKYGYGISNIRIRRSGAGLPIWPSGFVGSISHSGDIIAALVAPNSLLNAVGLDVQKIVPLRQNIAKRIADKTELDWANENTEELNLRSLIVFSAKESYFKAIYPSLGRSISYRDIQLRPEISEDGLTFQASMKTFGNYPKGWQILQKIYVQVIENYIVSMIAVSTTR